MNRPWTVFQMTWSKTARSDAVEWNVQWRMSAKPPKTTA